MSRVVVYYLKNHLYIACQQFIHIFSNIVCGLCLPIPHFIRCHMFALNCVWARVGGYEEVDILLECTGKHAMSAYYIIM